MKMLMGSPRISAKLEVGAGQAYTLTVLNENSKFQQFAMFQTIPDIIGPSTNPLSLAWMIGATAPGKPGNPSQSQFQWQINYSATTGYIQDLGTTLDPRRFSTASNVDVQLNSQNSLTATYLGNFPNGAPAFPADPADGTKSLILVQADGTILTTVQQSSVKLSINVGIAMDHKPTVAVQLLPNLLYQFTPKPTYYIIAGSFVEGQVIDTATSTSAFEVKYQGITDRTIVFTEENQFKTA